MTLTTGDETSDRKGVSPPVPGSTVGAEKVGFDEVNALIRYYAFPDHIAVIVNVPLEDASMAEAKVVLGSPLRSLPRDGRCEYSMKVDRELSVFQLQRKAGGNIELHNRDGLLWEIPSMYLGAPTVLLDHEPKVKEFLGSRFKADGVFIDVGANAGAYSLRALSRGMVVHSFEPNPENAKLLKRNAEINHLQADILEYALGASEGRAKISQNGATSRIMEDGVEVAVRTLDSFKFPRVDLLKVDVEGYELEVFRGVKDTLARCHPAIMIEMHHWIGAEAEAEIFSILRENGYRFEYLDTYDKGMHLTAVRR